MEGRSAYNRGMDHSVKPGAELSQEEIETCVSVIRAGCAVDPESASQELPHAIAVAIVRAGEEIVGVGAVKSQRPDYATRIASDEKSGFLFDPEMHELGYVAVLESSRDQRLSSQIVERLLACYDGPLWATTSSARMRTSLKNRGFVRRGKDWPSSKKGKQLSLWIKQGK